MRLSHGRFLKARDYIPAHGDDITRAWYRYCFEDRDVDAFMTVLAQHQHENGGFGGLIYEFDYLLRQQDNKKDGGHESIYHLFCLLLIGGSYGIIYASQIAK